MSTINIQPVVTANGETILSVFTPMGRYTCVLGPDFLMKMNEANVQGSKALGLGGLRYSNTSSSYDSITNFDYTNKLHIYFYNSGGEEAVKFGGKLPCFVSGYLDVDTSKITAKVCDRVKTEDITDTREGLVKERLGLFNICGTMCGITAYWPQGYGTGTFDSMCVSLVDLEQLKTHSCTVDYRQPIYAGINLAVEKSTSPDSPDLCYIRNGVEGITDENTFLVKFYGRAGLWDYNLITGDIVQSKSTYSGYMGMWGYPQYVIDGVLYGVTTRETATENFNNSSTPYLFSYNLTDKTSVVGSSFYLNDASTLLKVGQDLYVNIQSYSWGSTSSSYKPNYRKITLSTMTTSSTTLTHTVPSYLGYDYSIDSFDDGTYLLHDIKHMVSFKFTDLSNIEGSIVEPYWVCIGQPVTVGEKTYFMAFHRQGFYYGNYLSSDTKDNANFQNVCYGYNKYMLLTGDIGPLLAYGQFSKTYEKTADMDFTTNYYINVTSSN